MRGSHEVIAICHDLFLQRVVASASPLEASRLSHLTGQRADAPVAGELGVASPDRYRPGGVSLGQELHHQPIEIGWALQRQHV